MTPASKLDATTTRMLLNSDFAWGCSSRVLGERALTFSTWFPVTFIWFLFGLTEVLLHRWFVFQAKSYVPGTRLQLQHHNAIRREGVAENRVETSERGDRGNHISRMFDRVDRFGCRGQSDHAGVGGQ